MRIIVLIILLSSCSANWHLKRALIKDPSLFRPRTYVIDTVIVKDSFTKVDTFTLNEVDTFVTDTGKVRLTIYRNRNFFKTKIEVKSDTIRIKESVEMPPQIIYKGSKGESKWYMAIISFLVIVILSILWRRNW